MLEMATDGGEGSWLSCVESIRTLLNLPKYHLYLSGQRVSSDVSGRIKSQFDIFTSMS